MDEARFRLLDVVALVGITSTCLVCSVSVVVTGNIVVGSVGFVVVWLLGVLAVVSDWRHRMKNWRIRQLEDELTDLKEKQVKIHD